MPHTAAHIYNVHLYCPRQPQPPLRESKFRFPRGIRRHSRDLVFFTRTPYIFWGNGGVRVDPIRPVASIAHGSAERKVAERSGRFVAYRMIVTFSIRLGRETLPCDIYDSNPTHDIRCD
jgi:hypothetical protein